MLGKRHKSVELMQILQEFLIVSPQRKWKSETIKPIAFYIILLYLFLLNTMLYIIVIIIITYSFCIRK